MINAQIAAQRLKKLRVDKGLSHQKLSEALSDFGVDVSPRSLMNYESAAKDEFHSKSQSISKMNASTLVALAEFFDVSTDYLLGLNDAPTADIEVQAIYNYTGLDSIVIMRLHDEQMMKQPRYLGEFFYSVSRLEEYPALFAEICQYWGVGTHTTPAFITESFDEKFWDFFNLARIQDILTKMKEKLSKPI